MKKILLILLLNIIIIPFTVSADEIITASCKGEDNIYVCNIYANVEYEISAVDFKYSLPENVTSYEFVINENIWLGSSDNNWVTLYSEDNSKGKILLGTIKVESSKLSNKDITFKEIKVYDSKYEESKQKKETKKKIVNKETKKDKNYLFIIIPSILIIGILLIILIIKKGAIA